MLNSSVDPTLPTPVTGPNGPPILDCNGQATYSGEIFNALFIGSALFSGVFAILGGLWFPLSGFLGNIGKFTPTYEAVKIGSDVMRAVAS